MTSFILFLLLFLVHTAIEPFPAGAEVIPDKRRWTKTDTLAETAFAVLVYLDWRQTVEFTQHPDKYQDCEETNPLLGKHPSHKRVNFVMGTSLIAHALIARQLPQPYRGWWQFIWIGVEADVVRTNDVVLGVGVRF